MAEFLQITFWFKDQVPDEGLLKKKMDLAIDWVCPFPNCWIVYTTADPAKWWERIKPLVQTEDRVLIVGIDINKRQGWLPKWVWQWIKKER